MSSILHELDSEEGSPAALRTHLAHTLHPFARWCDALAADLFKRADSILLSRGLLVCLFFLSITKKDAPG